MTVRRHAHRARIGGRIETGTVNIEAPKNPTTQTVMKALHMFQSVRPIRRVIMKIKAFIKC